MADMSTWRSGVQPQDMALQMGSIKKGPPFAGCPSIGVSGLNEEDGFDIGLHRIFVNRDKMAAVLA